MPSYTAPVKDFQFVLHDVLQIAMGWENCHLHEFVATTKVAYGPQDPDGGMSEAADEMDVPLRALLQKVGDKATYEYDFGDSWIHAVELEKRVDSEKLEYPSETFVKEGKSVFSGKVRAAICIGGERSGPPEDCGGMPGLYYLLEIKKKPAAKRTADDRERLEWLGEWDETVCDLSSINEMLGKMRVKKAMLGE